jgi:hypothetical protein
MVPTKETQRNDSRNFFGALQFPEVLAHWRKPQHEEFRPRNGWSLFNAFTEAYKEINPHTAIARCQALHGLFDGAVAFAS